MAQDSVLRGVRVALGLAKPKVRVVVLGLDGAGKTAVVAALRRAAPSAGGSHGGGSEAGAPTLARVRVRTPAGALKLVLADLPGGQAAAWPRHYAAAQGVLWVVDAADPLRLQAAQDALDRAASSADLAAVPFLIVVNKTEAAGALSPKQVEAALEPERMSGGAREWAVCSAAGGDALVAGVTWLAQAIRRRGSGGAPEA